MRASHPDDVRPLLRSALDALKRGDKNAARSLAEQAASLAPRSEDPLLVLAALTSPEVSLAYIKQALRINPESQPARQALEWALKRQRDPSTDDEEDLFEIGPLLSAKLAVLAESVLEPDPAPKPIHPATGPAIPAETPPEHEPLSEPVQLPASPAAPDPSPARAQAPIQRTTLPLSSPKTDSPAARPQNKPSPSRAKIAMISALAFGALVCFGILAFWFGGPLLERMSPAAQPIQPEAASPVVSIPTPDCSPPTLTLATRTFQMQSLSPAPDGSLPTPASEPGIAYWLEGADSNYAFVLSPLTENVALVTGLPEGATATATWANCNSVTFTLSAPQPGTFDPAELPAQSSDDILVFVQTDPSGSGLVLNGSLAEQTITVLDTPMPDESGVLAEIGLLDTVTSPDGNSVQLTVSIYNFGEAPFNLSTSDISLTPSSGAPLELTRSDPRLPEKVDPGETKEFTFTFPRPATPTATLRIYTVEYDIEGY